MSGVTQTAGTSLPNNTTKGTGVTQVASTSK